MDLKYFRWMYNTCSFLGMTPMYNFQNQTLSRRKLNICLRTMAIIHDIFVLAFVEIYFLPDEKANYPLMNIILIQIPADYSYILMPLGLSLLAIIYGNKWKTFLRKLLKIHNSLNFVKCTERPDLIMIIITTVFEINNVLMDLLRSLNEDPVYNFCYFFYTAIIEVSKCFSLMYAVELLRITLNFSIYSKFSNYSYIF